MKRVPLYRRTGRKGKLSGLKERIVWQLSKRPMTGRELCAVLDVELKELNKAMYHTLKRTSTVHITASEWVTGADGLSDRTYTLERKARLVVPQGKTRIFTLNSMKHMGEDKKQEAIAAAKRRARLIKAGLYINEMG